LGFYSWEIIVTFWFDWSVITRRRAWKWPMVFYFVCKYSTFWANAGIVIAESVTKEVNCESLYVFTQTSGNFAVGCASTLLMLRMIAIWARNPYVMWPLVFINVGQWAILMHSAITVHAVWEPAAAQCVITAAPQIYLQLLYIYTMIFDFLVLLLSTIGLLRVGGRSGSGGSGLWSLLIKDGLVFFIVAFGSNLVEVILLLLNFNPVMNVMASLPAASITATVACRLFVRLSTYSGPVIELRTSAHRLTRPNGTGTRKVGVVDQLRTAAAVGGPKHQTQSGVHVQMDTYISRGNPSDAFGAVVYEHGTARGIKKDLESQHDDPSDDNDFDDEKSYGVSK